MGHGVYMHGVREWYNHPQTKLASHTKSTQAQSYPHPNPPRFSLHHVPIHSPFLHQLSWYRYHLSPFAHRPFSDRLFLKWLQNHTVLFRRNRYENIAGGSRNGQNRFNISATVADIPLLILLSVFPEFLHITPVVSETVYQLPFEQHPLLTPSDDTSKLILFSDNTTID